MRVAVRAGGLNPVDARRRAGTFPANAPLALGSEFSGTVLESTDPRWKPGDAVVGWRAPGSDGDLVVTSGDLLAAKPDDVSWFSATSVGGDGQTAMTVLKDVPLNAGDTIVVHGASGGIGSVLVQLAVARCITVIATASEPNHEYLRWLGAVPVAHGEGLSDRIAEAAQGRPIAASIDLAGSTEAGDFAVEVSRAGGQSVTLVPETMMSHRLR